MEMYRWILLLLVVSTATTLAQREAPERAPNFAGDTLPTPPQQDAPWPHQADDPLAAAAATLFAQGLADPRGLPYHEIEVGVGNPWSGGGTVAKIHGWVLPDDGSGSRYAVGWNGLVYPVVRVGEPADLRADFTPPADAADGRIPRSRYSIALEAQSLMPLPVTDLKLALLLRLGEQAVLARIAPIDPANGGNADPYLEMANDWAWFAYERAVCAHERRDDRLARVDLRLLQRLQPLVEAEVERRALDDERPHSNARMANGKRPSLYGLFQLAELAADNERRFAKPQAATGDTDETARLIDRLQDVSARQWSQPGGVSLGGDPIVQALVAKGDGVVDTLIEVMAQDTRLTRSVSFHRDFHRSRHVIPVADAARAVLSGVLHVNFETPAEYRAYWQKMRKLPLIERYYATLQDDTATPAQWLEAAKSITQGTHERRAGAWIESRALKPGEAVTLRGESLRDDRSPSVSDLMARRSDDIAAIRTGTTHDHFLYMNAAEMAELLAKWDPPAAIPVLRRRLDRAWHIGEKPEDSLANNGSPVERFAGTIASMTLVRASCGDETAYDEYAAWIQRADIRNIGFGAARLLPPLEKAVDRPSIRAALDYLLNDAKSPWSDLFADGNGWLVRPFWKSSLPLTPAFRRQARRGLADTSVIGRIEFSPKDEWRGRNVGDIVISGLRTGYHAGGDDEIVVPPDNTIPIRRCDAYAYYYAHHHEGPAFQLHWKVAQRDAGIEACRLWLTAQAVPTPE